MVIDHDTKVAVLLQMLGAEATTSILDNIEINRANKIMGRMKELEANPAETETVETVLEDFETFFRFAIETANVDSYWSELVEESDEEEEESPATVPFSTTGSDASSDDEPIMEFGQFEPTDQPFADLNRLHPVQIATAIKHEKPRTISIVLSALKESRVAACVSELPDSLRGDVMSIMMSDAEYPDFIKKKMVSTAVLRALEVRRPEPPKPKPDETVASVLRELPRDVRSQIVDHLKESNAEEIENLQKMLYLFEDIINYHDRSIQKILAEVEKADLVIALQDCPEDISSRVLTNLSKRARQALVEELEFAQKESEEVVANARSNIAAIIAEMDQTDQLMMA